MILNISSFSRRLVLPSLDKVIAGVVILGTGGMVYQAYDEGSFPLKKQVSSRDVGGDNRLKLTPAQCRTLESKGFLVIDDFLTTKEVVEAAQAAKRVEARRPFGMSNMDNVKQYPNKFTGLRSDGKVCFFDPDYVGATETVPSEPLNVKDKDAPIHHIRALLRGLAQSIANSDFQGFEDGANNDFLPNIGDKHDHVKHDRYSSMSIGVPETIQLGSYDALKADQNIPRSNYNAPHRDGARGDWWNTGIMGHLRCHYLRKRYITGIVYLNNEQKDGGGPWLSQRDGGQLRLYMGAEDDDWTGDSCLESRVVDIAPHGGRLVLFSSEHILHAVRPCFRDRIACSIWFTLN